MIFLYLIARILCGVVLHYIINISINFATQNILLWDKFIFWYEHIFEYLLRFDSNFVENDENYITMLK